jgi:hypothetical protein
MKKFKTALLLTTYNWPVALNLLLNSILKQTVIPDEIIIADDGSGYETKSLIDDFLNSTVLPLIHVWHQDEGFQRTKILNKSIAQSSCDYIIQVDGDCILHSKFVEDHIANARKEQFLYGSRVNTLENALEEILDNKTIQFSNRSKLIKNKGRNIYLPFLSMFFTKSNKLSKKLRGCNLSYWRQDFLEVNGYNEDMTGWGREDSEFALRLINKSVYGRRLKYQGILYHIWHSGTSKNNLHINQNIQNQTVLIKRIYCSNGVDKYL